MISSSRCAIVLLALLGVVTCTSATFAQTSSAATARATVDTLTSRSMSGRGYERDGHLVAARYIASRFRSLGLDSLAAGYLHPFRFMHWGFAPNLSFRIGERELVPGWEFLPAGRSGSGSLDRETRIVRAGDGLVAPFSKIDAYRGLAPMGAIVVIDEKIDSVVAADTTIPRERLGSWSRIEDAIRLGARGVILLVDRLTYEGPQRGISIPVFEVLREKFPADVRSISFSIARAPREVVSNNVVAMIPGDGSTDSLVMIVGHYDHLGMLGDSVYFPGANDNAGGIALMLDLAAELKRRPLRYPTMLVAFSAEEVGLVGSGNFIDAPMLDLKRTRFLINLDMVASGTDGVMALGGVENPAELALLRQVADSLGGIEIRTRANAPNSDHYFFLKSGIRGFYLYPFVGYQPYHNVADRPETLQWEVYERMRGLVRGLLRKI
jgi:aminopeptidase YwaD